MEEYDQVSTRSSREGPQADVSSRDDGKGMRPSTLEKSEALRIFKNWFKGDAQHSKDWRVQAKTDFDFVAGDQWSEKDQALLKDQNRTPITFNRTLTLIKAVAGMEINGRHEIAYLPRKLEDTAIDEVLTGASKWMADECDGEDEESEAFQKTLICGIGVLEHRMDYLEEQEGKYIEDSIDPLEYYWDRTARKKNLVDRRRDWHVKTMPLGDAQQLFPGFDRNQLDAKWAYSNELTTPQKTLEERRVRDENSSGPLSDQDEVTLVHVEWWEREDCWCVADEVNNKLLKYGKEGFDRLQRRHAEIQDIMARRHDEVQDIMAQANPAHQPQAYHPQELRFAKVQRKVFKQAYLGAEILDLGPARDPQQFSRSVITGEFHHNRRTWFGIVRTLRDPQMWGNKWLSQILHILNTTAKGGIIAETDAFEDQRQAEDKYARPDGIVWASRGAISGKTGSSGSKIMEKPGKGDFGGYVELLSMAINATRDVTGINLELLGQKDMNQPGILEAMRKQAGMTVLATMFDALRRMRKIVGRIRLYYIQNFISDGRIIRITGQNGQQAIQLIRERTLGEYDVVVDDTPTSPNQKEANWAIISSLLPAFKDQLMARPEVFLSILSYSPLPSQMVSAIAKLINTPPTKSPDQQKAEALQISAAVAKISKDQAQAELYNKQAQSTEATAMYDIAYAQNLLLKHQGDMTKAALEWEKQRADTAKTAAMAPIEAAHTAAQIRTEHAKAEQIKAQTAGEHADTTATHVGTLIDALAPLPHHEDAFPPPQPVGAQ